MKPKSKVSVLVMIITLMVIIIPAAIYGTIVHFTSTGIPRNPNKTFYNKGYLYFYDGNDLLGTYKCSNNLCDYAYETIDDDKYSLNYFNDGNIEQISLVNYKYAFLIDSDGTDIKNNYENIPITIYDVENQLSKVTVNAIKNYSMGINGDYFIIKNEDDKWGVLKLEDDISLVIPYSYDYIGLRNNMNGDKLNSSSFVVYDGISWKLLSNKNEDLTREFNYPIVDYNNNYVAIKNEDLLYLYNYNGELSLSYGFKNIKFLDNLVGVLNSFNEFYIIDPSTGMEKSKRYSIDSISDVSYERKGNSIIVTINDEEETFDSPVDNVTDEEDQEDNNDDDSEDEEDDSEDDF